MKLENYKRLVQDYRSRINHRLFSLASQHEPAYLYDPVKYVFRSKGKRLRPILTLLVANMFDVPEEEAMPAAISVEILHNFSLVHDDIMDQDDMRHGLPSVFRKWDESTAILAGDVIFAMAYAELSKVKNNLLPCFRIFNEATIKLCEGQALDKTFESQESVTLDEYLNMVKLKTGTLLSLCCQLGALMGNATKAEILDLARFGEVVGQTFQIQDDVLEVFSSAQKMGKSLGSDIASQKKTYLTCKTLEKDPSGWKTLMDSFKERDVNQEVLPALRLYFKESGIVKETEEEIDRLVSLCRSKLKRFNHKGRLNLEHFINMLVTRER